MKINRKFDLQFFADGDGTANGDGGNVNEPEKVFTQADLDRVVKERIDRERKKYADYDELKKSKEELEALKRGELSELERERKEKEALKAAKEAAEAEVNFLKTGQLKARLLAASNLPLDLADRVIGSTEEEIKSDIEVLKKFFKPSSVGNPSNPGNPKEESSEERGRRMAAERQTRSLPTEGFDPWKK